MYERDKRWQIETPFQGDFHLKSTVNQFDVPLKTHKGWERKGKEKKWDLVNYRMLNKLSSTYFILQGAGLYSRSIKKVEEGIQGTLKKVNELTGNIIANIISKI